MAFVDLKRQYQRLEKEMNAALAEVLRHCQFIMGPEIQKLEAELARRAGTKHAVVCASGTDALLLPLLDQGLGPGQAVFTSPFTFIATAEVISLLGATPVFVDIDPRTFNIDPNRLEEAVTKVARAGKLKPAAVIPVDLFGLPADYDPIMALAQDHGLLVLEDAAQSFGGQYKGRPVGGLGHVGATSFFPAKPLGCYGDGGAVFTNDDEQVTRLRSLRVHGQGRHKYENVRIGVNARLDTVQAAVLLVKLTVFEDEIAARQSVAETYTRGLERQVVTPSVPEGYSSAWAQYSVLTDRRDEVTAALNKKGVPTAVYYPIPLHLQPAFAALGYQRGDFPHSESAADRIFSLPMHPYLREDELDFIVRAVVQVAGERT
ncbi:MAG: DegT/DnrJ/EryC1/StrS family aminotransferase [Thermodesulfobacteriota bacterium]